MVGTSWREVLNPRSDGRAVQLPRALRAGAIVLWRTWVEDLPDEAEAITALALADIVAAAKELRGATEWLVLLDEFGSVMEGNASRGALGVLGRARSSGGQAIVVTQSAADIPTATGEESLRESLTDNFSAFVVHRQTSAESREWVSKLLGTRELWQSTDRTGGAGRYAEGAGSRRRVREFLVRPDQLKNLGVGEACVWTAAGPPPELVEVAIPPPLVARPAASKEPAYGDAGPTELPEYKPPEAGDAAKGAPEDTRKQGDGEPGAEKAADSPASHRPRGNAGPGRRFRDGGTPQRRTASPLTRIEMTDDEFFKRIAEAQPEDEPAADRPLGTAARRAARAKPKAPTAPEGAGEPALPIPWSALVPREPSKRKAERLARGRRWNGRRVAAICGALGAIAALAAGAVSVLGGRRRGATGSADRRPSSNSSRASPVRVKPRTHSRERRHATASREDKRNHAEASARDCSASGRSGK